VIGMEHVYQARIKHVYQGVQGACPRQAVTSGAVGMGLKLVIVIT
jgi:hypothetical protein